MRFIKKSSEEEMVLAFLKAEIDSPRFKGSIEDTLSRLGYTRALIENANLNNSLENQARANCLAFRGFKNNQALFQGFPTDILWERISLSKKELGILKYANYPTWVNLSVGTRLIADGAKNIDIIQVAENTNTNVKAVQKLVESGAVFPELILVSKNKKDDLILIEGHTRATAYELAKDYLKDEIEVIVGYSEGLGSWIWY